MRVCEKEGVCGSILKSQWVLNWEGALASVCVGGCEWVWQREFTSPPSVTLSAYSLGELLCTSRGKKSRTARLRWTKWFKPVGKSKQTESNLLKNSSTLPKKALRTNLRALSLIVGLILYFRQTTCYWNFAIPQFVQRTGPRILSQNTYLVEKDRMWLVDNLGKNN